MYAKIQQPDGSWEIHEAKTIQYSDSPVSLEKDAGNRSPQMYKPFIPIAFQKIFERRDPSIMWQHIQIIPFQDNLIYEYVAKSEPSEIPQQEVKWSNFPENWYGTLYCNIIYSNIENKLDIPKEWCGLPLYSYVILDNTKAIVFPTKAYILNDDGKTIAKVG